MLADVATALGAHGIFIHAAPALGDLPALAEHAHAAVVFILHGMVVEDFAGVGTLLVGAPAHAPRADGVTAQHPVGHVEVVDVLLDDVVAAKPVEHVPILHLVLHLGRGTTPLLLQISAPGLGAHRTAIPINAHVEDVANRAIMEPADRGEVVGLMPALEADADLEILLLRLLGCGKHLTHTGTVHGHGLLHEDMFTLAHGFLEHPGTQSRRRRENNHVGGGDGLLVRLGSDEHVPLIHGDARVVLDGVADFFERSFHLVLEGIADGNKLGLGRRLERLRSRASATTAAADERDTDGVAGRSRVGETLNRQGAEQRAAREGGGGGFQKAAARKLRVNRRHRRGT